MNSHTDTHSHKHADSSPHPSHSHPHKKDAASSVPAEPADEGWDTGPGVGRLSGGASEGGFQGGSKLSSKDKPINPLTYRYKSFLVRLIPMRREDSERLESVAEHFSDDELEEIKFLLKKNKVKFSKKSFDTTKSFWRESSYLFFESKVEDPYVKAKADHYSKRLISAGREQVFSEFSKQAEEKILSLIAPSIIGRDEVKLAGLLQLFAKEKVHILLLGDPSTGKTVILRSIADLAPVSSFGLGSGASKAGLTLTVSGKDVIRGLLPLADGGIACIDELNLMKNQDLAGLLNAMEKGFITYDKGNNHLRLDARVKVFASANPEGDKFVGKTVSVLKSQIPFEDALLSRFHLLFLLRRPGDKEFLKISEKIIRGSKDNDLYKGDADFVKEYIEYANDIEVDFDKGLSVFVQDFVKELRRDEDDFLIEISPRTVVGMINMAKASARLRLSDKVSKEDVDRVIGIFRAALYIRKEELDK
ncbi:hypothetical protein JW711_04235 [Candidatus Woesearchaeota archaeon]|nr:hypothetical protein [Candidatus Woesearchaeota archaeon]